MKEEALVVDCEGDLLVGVAHHSPGNPQLGVVLIVAGGPQYRVGAHRQFVLLGRELARAGYPVIRFDHRGTGDSSGAHRGFLDMDADIRTAINSLQEKNPGLRQVVLWGECESASAAAYYAHKDDRVAGLFLVNPWVRTEAGLAKTYLKHHYRDRLKDPEFWRKVRSGNFSIGASLKSMFELVRQALSSRTEESSEKRPTEDLSPLPLTTRLEKSMLRFSGPIFVLTSGRDHIAREYTDFMAGSRAWQDRSRQSDIVEKEMTDADHTFSRSHWREELFGDTLVWVTRIKQSMAPKET